MEEKIQKQASLGRGVRRRSQPIERLELISVTYIQKPLKEELMVYGVKNKAVVNGLLKFCYTLDSMSN